jgi:hypothetical protein
MKTVLYIVLGVIAWGIGMDLYHHRYHPQEPMLWDVIKEHILNRKRRKPKRGNQRLKK